MFTETKSPQKDEVPHINDLKNVFKYGMRGKPESHAYMRKAIRAMRISEDENDPKLAGYIWQVFGHESKLNKDKFLERIE